VSRLSNVVIREHLIPRIEGHAEFYVEIDSRNKRVLNVEFRIIEGMRLFEVAILNRRVDEVPLIVSRICGICGHAHAICSAIALENAMGVEVHDDINLLREIILALNTIESNLLHVTILTAPDMFEVQTINEISPKVKKLLIECFKIRELAGKVLGIICGDRIHPRNVVPGGFTYIPSIEKARYLIEAMYKKSHVLIELLRSYKEKYLVKLDRVSHYVSLHRDDRYTLLNGDVVIDSRIKIPSNTIRGYIVESISKNSTSKTCLLYGTNPYMVGSLARVNNNAYVLVNEIREVIKDLGLKIPSTNPFMIPLAQILEVLNLIYMLRDVCEDLKLRQHKVSYNMRKGVGIGVVEAPRGTLYHSYVCNDYGRVLSVDIVTPTVQNIADIESSIKIAVQNEISKRIDLTRIKILCEKIIRCYDPCISCSVHVIRIR